MQTTIYRRNTIMRKKYFGILVLLILSFASFQTQAATLAKWQLEELGFRDREVDFMRWFSGKLGSNRKSMEFLSVFIQHEMDKDGVIRYFQTHLPNSLTSNYLSLLGHIREDEDHFPGLYLYSILKGSYFYDKRLGSLLRYKAYYDSL